MKWFYVMLFSMLMTSSFAQTDSVFWFAAPEITNDNSSPHTDRPIIMRMTAFSVAANVTISQPANPSFSIFNVSIPANSSISVDLTSQINLIESKPANQILNSGLLISSSAAITAYYEEASSSNPEMFVLKGKNALGDNFFIPAQNILSNWDFYAFPPVIPYSSFDIVATEDNTSIIITPANNIVGHNAGIAFTVVLNKGQVYSAAAVSRLPKDHLMGSSVTSNKKIAITIKDDSIGGDGYAGCLDLAGDQIVPLALVGTKYISLPGFLNNPAGKPSDHLFILATDDNTSININGTLVATINKGQTYHDSSYNEVKYLITGKPTYALHLSGFGCEVGHALLPQIECTGSQKIAFTRSNASTLYMNILVPSGYENQFKLNGNTTIITPAKFNVVPFSGGLWKYAQIFVDVSQLAVGVAAIVENSGIEFHLSIIHGDAITGARYGYFSDFNKLNVTATSNAVNGTICAKSDLKFFTNFNNALSVHFNWTGPNGFSDTTANPILPNITTSGTGLYTLTATKFSCNAVNVPLNIVVNPTPNPLLTTNAPICTGNNLSVNANFAGGSFNWIGPNGFISTNATNNINNVMLLANGYYKVITNVGTCISNDSILVVINPTPSAKITIINNNACLLQTIQLTNNNTIASSNYKWLLPNGTNTTNQSININSVTFSDTGKYILTAFTADCSASDTALLLVKPIPKVQFVSLAEVCSNVPSFSLSANETTGIAGNGGVFTGLGVTSNGLFTPSIVGDGITNIRYTYTANNGCIAFKDQNITVNPTPTITLDDELYVKFGNSIQLDAQITGNFSSIVWQDASNTLSDKTINNPIAAPLSETLYRIKAFTNKNCIAIDSVLVKIASDLFIPNVFSPNGDGKNDKWEVEDKAKILHLKAAIFDRYGKLVKTLFGNKIAWDGLYNGQPLPIATYYYVLTITGGNISQNVGGWIQLLR
jgi:gliding motility-associated-like protein